LLNEQIRQEGITREDTLLADERAVDVQE